MTRREQIESLPEHLRAKATELAKGCYELEIVQTGFGNWLLCRRMYPGTCGCKYCREVFDLDGETKPRLPERSES